MTPKSTLRLLALGVWAIGVFFGTIANGADSTQIPTISVSGTGSAQVAPDMAVLSLSVVREAKTARAAVDQNSDAMRKILAALKEKSIGEKDLQTSNYNIQPRYRQIKTSSGNQDSLQIFAYRVSNSLTVRVRDLEKLGGILDLVVTLGVNSGGNVHFTNIDPTAAISLARTRAMEDAVAKAKTLVEAAGAKIVGILSISENVGNPSPVALSRSAFKQESDGAVPLAKGENSYRVTIQASWKIE